MLKFVPLVLAAGKGTRMKSAFPKVLHPILGKPMVIYVLNALRAATISPKIGVIIGYKAQEVQAAIAAPDIDFILQPQPMGTGHAIMCAQPFWEKAENVLVLNGDLPLIQTEIIIDLIKLHQEKKSDVTFITALIKGETQYGVVIRNKAKKVKGIVEVAERKEVYSQYEINAGIYCFKTQFLKQFLPLLKPSVKKGEYYITDLINLGASYHKNIFTKTVDLEQVQGVNNRWELARCARILQHRILEKHMRDGVTIIAPENTYIEPDVKIGVDTTIESGVHIRGQTKIGKNCLIGTGTVINNSIIADEVTIKPYCVITESQIENKATIGPFAHLRPLSHIGSEARIGNFVEVKKSYVGAGSKASHLTYLGDTQVGVEVNIGAGTITCNYDGKRKHKTTIEDRAFIGSNTALVAPVKIGENALIGAGSVITEDVPANTLAIARGKQVHKPRRKK